MSYGKKTFMKETVESFPFCEFTLGSFPSVTGKEKCRKKGEVSVKTGCRLVEGEETSRERK